jgi:hypothetical protein
VIENIQNHFIFKFSKKNLLRQNFTNKKKKGGKKNTTKEEENQQTKSRGEIANK